MCYKWRVMLEYRTKDRLFIPYGFCYVQENTRKSLRKPETFKKDIRKRTFKSVTANPEDLSQLPISHPKNSETNPKSNDDYKGTLVVSFWVWQ